MTNPQSVQDRVDYIEVTPSVSRLAHARIVTFMTVLLVSFWAAGGGSSTRLLCISTTRAAAGQQEQQRLQHYHYLAYLETHSPPPHPKGLDCAFLQHTIAATLASGGHSVQLLFAFEYVILASSIVATAAKYVMSMVDAAMEGRWEGKVRFGWGGGGGG
jgi:E3 ubiquitin-protein ligase synoviolin